jgi:hypothetical protein
MTHVAELAWASFIAVLVSGLPLCLKTVESSIEHMDDGSDFNCCPRLHGNTSGSFQCPGIAGQRCPSALRTITHNKLRNMVLTVRNPAGKLGRGQNGFCIEFTQAKTGEKTPMSRMRMDVTLRIGRTEAARALSDVAPAGIGLYCGRMVLGIPGTWKLSFQYGSSAGSGRVSVLESVKFIERH